MATRTGTIILQQQGSNKLLYINVSQNSTCQSDLYTPIGLNLSLPVGATVPTAVSRISNAGTLPQGTTIAWESTYSTATLGTYQWRIVITYPDTCVDVVTLTTTIVNSIYSYTLGIYSGHETMGAVTGTPSGGYAAGTVLNAVATPNSGFEFVCWRDISDTTVSFSPNFSYTMPSNSASLRAMFKDVRPLYTFSVGINEPTFGSITGTANGTYLEGASMSVSASANSGYKFNGWSNGNGIVSNSLTYAFLMPAAALNLTAMFSAETDFYFTPSIRINGHSEAPIPSIPGTAAGVYAEGTSISLVADQTMSDKYVFVGFYDKVSGLMHEGSITYSFNMGARNEEWETVYDSLYRYVNVSNTAGGTTSGTPTGYYTVGTDIAITATATSGYQFDGWYDGAGDGASLLTTNLTYNFNIPVTFASYNYYAKFSPAPGTTFNFIKGVFDNLTERGSVSGSANGSYAAGVALNVSATANNGYYFDYWMDSMQNIVSNSVSYAFTMPAENTTYEAVFNPLPVAYSANKTSLAPISTCPNPQVVAIHIEEIVGGVSSPYVGSFQFGTIQGVAGTGSTDVFGNGTIMTVPNLFDVVGESLKIIIDNTYHVIVTGSVIEECPTCLTPMINHIEWHDPAGGNAPYFKFWMTDLAGTKYENATTMILSYSLDNVNWSTFPGAVADQRIAYYWGSYTPNTPFPVYFKVSINGGTGECDIWHTSEVFSANVTFTIPRPLKDLYSPQAINLTTPTGTLPAASACVVQEGLPVGTTYSWIVPPVVNTPGQSEGTLRVTYSDATFDTIYPLVTAVGDLPPVCLTPVINHIEWWNPANGNAPYFKFWMTDLAGTKYENATTMILSYSLDNVNWSTFPGAVADQRIAYYWGSYTPNTPFTVYFKVSINGGTGECDIWHISNVFPANVTFTV